MPLHDETIRSMIAHENQLMNQRTTWLVTVQGLLFAALGFAWDRHGAQPLIFILCLLGTAVSLLSLVGLVAASRAIHRLYAWWQANRPADYAGPDVVGLPPRTEYLNPWHLLPVLFVLAWVAVASVGLMRSP